MKRLTSFAFVLCVAVGSAAGGYWWARHGAGVLEAASSANTDRAAPRAESEATDEPGGEATPTARRVLYWYDPMYPTQHFDKPGKSPFMDMQLVPRYADESRDGESTVRIDAGIVQNLGIRIAEVTIGSLPNRIDAVGTLQFNDRDRAVVQARSAGFVERVYGHAPGDVIAAGSPLADLLVPEWAGAQTEFLALVRQGDAALKSAARERLRLLGMPPGLIARVERSGRAHPIYTVSADVGGVIDTLEVRAGMTVMAGQTLATVKGIGTVWLDVAVPEGLGNAIAPDTIVEAQLDALPGETLRGNVLAVLPAADTATRTLTVRVQFDNPDGRLRPGMYARAQLRGTKPPAGLLLPAEALIRTGMRTLVMRVEADERYQPVEVTVGREVDGRAEVLSGLEAGDRIVVSGQFLIDSEASLRGVSARLADESTLSSGAKDDLHYSEGAVVAIDDHGIEIDHGPFRSLSMPAMQMRFPLARAELGKGIEPGEHVRFGVRKGDGGLIVERIEALGPHAAHGAQP